MNLPESRRKPSGGLQDWHPAYQQLTKVFIGGRKGPKTETKTFNHGPHGALKLRRRGRGGLSTDDTDFLRLGKKKEKGTARFFFFCLFQCPCSPSVKIRPQSVDKSSLVFSVRNFPCVQCVPWLYLGFPLFVMFRFFRQDCRNRTPALPIPPNSWQVRHQTHAAPSLGSCRC